ncbi:MAG: ferredoxin [Pseudomonadota bacterium]
MTTYAALESAARARHLTILGGFHPTSATALAEEALPRGNLPEECETLLLLGPDEPRFWPAFTASREYLDGAPHPMDRWSQRVIGTWADELCATAVFPFGGPPYQPFYTWALRTGRIHASPVHLLVHDRAGLFVSFRGALALRWHVELPPPPPNPCNTCAEKPCGTACSVRALTTAGYDVPRCKDHLATTAGRVNLETGCGVRRSCPVSQQFRRLPAQSAYHMRQFAGG